MLEVLSLRKQFGTILAVDDVSFQVRQGQIFGLIGPNGAGKTTTIRMIMDIIQPDSGSVSVGGRIMNEQTKHLVGYLPEERGLYRKNRLINVITYFGMLKGMTAKQARDAALPKLEKFSLTQYLKRNVEELSKGNQQKVQFIISTLHSPVLLVLDELFSGLDPVNQLLMKEELLGLRNEGKAIIFSTHHMEQAEKLCDELLMIDHGRTVLHGSPTDIKTAYGRNALRVDFTGDGSVLRNLPGVQHADIAQNYAELTLHPDTRTNDVIEAMLASLELSSVARLTPSLHSIFIDIVGRPPEHEEFETAIPPETAMAATQIRDAVAKKHFYSFFLSLAAMVLFVVLAVNAMSMALTALAVLSGGSALRSLLLFRKRKTALRNSPDTGKGEAQ
jgi:ABC-2 type transport system ATP-binding protein